MFSFDMDGLVDTVGKMHDRLFEHIKRWDEAQSRWGTYQWENGHLK